MEASIFKVSQIDVKSTVPSYMFEEVIASSHEEAAVIVFRETDGRDFASEGGDTRDFAVFDEMNKVKVVTVKCHETRSYEAVETKDP